MTGKALTAALLATALAAPAFAQDRGEAIAAELAAMRARIVQLEGEVAALKAKPAAAAPAPAPVAVADRRACSREKGKQREGVSP
jgi:type II secretory pathway component PulM